MEHKLAAIGCAVFLFSILIVLVFRDNGQPK